ncbi:hypothetical protein F1C76_13255 [Geodermatophilaceae bacterium NBWT11]|nr:hypothetical protein F1C76_13255 [Geodermatophilaceae bacterium NBWT11]
MSPRLPPEAPEVTALAARLDREWFDEYPEEDARVRPCLLGELRLPADGWVRVLRIAPGIGERWAVPPPVDDWVRWTGRPQPGVLS